MAKTNYNKMSNKPKEDVKQNVESVIEETVVETAEVENVEAPTPAPAPEYKKGVVVGCTKLNVRKAAKADAKIIGTLDAGTTVTIYDEVGEFYKVGPTNEYCMKKFISVK